MTIDEIKEREEKKIGQHCTEHGSIIKKGTYTYTFCPNKDARGRWCEGKTNQETLNENK